MKPMTTEEIDAIEAAWCKGRCIIRGNSSDTPDIDIQRLIATARLAPQWRKGSEPPTPNHDVYLSDGEYRFAYWTPGVTGGAAAGWRDSRTGTPRHPPRLWCELPPPPSEREGGR